MAQKFFIRVFYHFVLVFINASARNITADGGQWVYIGVASYDRSRIQNAAASHFYKTAQNGTHFLRPVGIFLSPTRISTNVLSDFTLEVIEPAPICDLYPRMESPT